jgi:hypothetical protein
VTSGCDCGDSGGGTEGVESGMDVDVDVEVEVDIVERRRKEEESHIAMTQVTNRELFYNKPSSELSLIASSRRHH